MSRKMDPEYNAMRRRMSRLRVTCGKKTALEAEDATPNADDPGFKDLVKFWRKHGIPIPRDLLSDMADETVRKAAGAKGRRRSRELEDLHMCASTGRLNLSRVTSVEEEPERVSDVKPGTKTANNNVGRRRPVGRTVSTDTGLLAGKPTRGSLKSKTGTSVTAHKRLLRSTSKT